MDNGNDPPAPFFWNFLMKNRKSPNKGLSKLVVLGTAMFNYQSSMS